MASSKNGSADVIGGGKTNMASSIGAGFSSVLLILLGCFLNNVVLEYIIHYDKGAGGLMTLFQFSFVAAVGLRRHVSCSWSRPSSSVSSSPSSSWSVFPSVRLEHKAPLWAYMRLTVLFFVISYANNKAFAWGISQPFNVVFRSSSLLVSFLIGYFAFNKKYSMREFASVVLVTLGVVLTTSAEFTSRTPLSSSSSSHSSSTTITGSVTASIWASCCDPSSIWSALVGEASSSELLSWSVGTLLLSSTLIGLAILGHMQNAVYAKYGSSSEENMFYSHLLPIPLFVIFGQDLMTHVGIWNASELWRILPFDTAPRLPCLWILCFLNVLTQWVCIEGVYKTTATLGTLTATWATTIRKFMSLVFSLLVFENYFTWNHYAGSALVFLGSFLYIIPSKAATVSSLEQKKKQ